jgi:hypothetical protein
MPRMDDKSKSSKTTWYVFTSTRWQMVNLVPVAAIGFDKIDRLLILVGKTGGAAAQNVDKQYAELPKAAVVEAMAKEQAAGARLSANTLEGDLDDMNYWRTAVSRFFAELPAPMEIIFNYTGGPKDVSIGVLLGLQDLARDRDDIAVRFVAKHARHISWPFESLREPVVMGRNSISLDTYLLAHGYREQRAGQRLAGERNALLRETLTRKLAGCLFSGGDAAVTGARVALLNKLQPQGFNDIPVLARAAAEDVASRRSLPTGSLDRPLLDFAASLAEALSGADGVELQGSKLRLDASMHQYLNGKWFEEWVWLRAREALSHSQASVHLGLILADAHDPRANQAKQDLELDVAIYCGDQLHVAECKTGRPKPGGLQPELDHLAHVKDAVLGPYGKGWLLRAHALMPDGGAGTEESGGWPAKSYAIAERLRLQVAAGAAEIEAVCGAFSQLAGRTGTAPA